MKPLCSLVLIVLLMQPLSSFSAERDTPLSAQPNEAVIQVKGIVCSYCSFGIQKKLSQLPFVDQSKYNKGSLVDIETQRITIGIKSGETLDIKQVYKSVLDGGYNPVKAVVADESDSITYDGEGEICTASC